MGASNKSEELVAEFARSVIAQNEAVEQHDPATGNGFALRYCQVAKELIKQHQDGINIFARLLNDRRIDVRTMAAAFLIPFRTDKSKAVLEHSAQGFGTVALGDKMALER